MFNFSLAAEIFNAPSGIYNENGKSVGYYVVSALAIVACFVLVFLLSGRDKREQSAKTKEMAYAGICIALSTVLSMFKLFEMPQGGSVTPASLLPIAFFAYMFGVKSGLLVCFAYGMLQALLGGYIVHPIQFLLDYPIAFAMVGLVGLFKKMDIKWGFLLGFAVAAVARYLVHSIGGMIFFAEYASEQTFGAIFAYSFGYNSFVFVDAIISMALGFAMVTNKSFVRLIKQASPEQAKETPTEGLEDASGSSDDK